MRRLLTFWCLCCSFWIVAVGGNAHRRAMSFLGEPVELAAQAPGERPAYYIFNNTSGKGFVILGGDDSDHDILGYSYKGSYEADDVPPALAEWLTMMDEQTTQLRQGRAARYRAAEVYDRIEPLLTTQWHQLAPYNLLTPEYESGKRSATGCVATAMAQLLNYYAYGAQTATIPVYMSLSLGVVMPELPATTFNYSIMKSQYSAGDTSESAQEVSRLMLYCGQAVCMNYGEESGAGIAAQTFSYYFGYNTYAYMARRSNYPAWAWDRLIYQQLSEAHPVLLTGFAFSTVGNEGHAFLCDGYDGAGLFHINWGWGGKCDGWFRLSESNPYGSGTGGGSGWDGFSINQHALINLFPATVPSDVRMTVNALNADQTTVTRNGVNEDFLLTVTASAFNPTAGHLSYDVGFGLYDGDERLDTRWNVGKLEVEPSMGTAFSKYLAIGEGVNSGQYTLRFVCRESGTEPWLWGYNGDLYLMLNIDGDTMTVEKPQTDLVVSGARFEGSRLPNTITTMMVTIVNQGLKLYDELYLFVNDKHTTGVGLFVDPGKTQEVPLHFEVPEGPVMLKLYTGVRDNGDGGYLPAGNLLWTGTMSATQREPDLKVENIVIDNRTFYNGKTAINGTTFRQTATLTNNDTEPFDSEVLAYLYKNEDEGDWFTYECYDAQKLTIAPGATTDVTFSFPDLTVGVRYLTVLYTNSPTGMKKLEPSQTYAYRILGDADDISLLPIAVSKKSTDQHYFDLQGRRIARPSAKDVYIVNGRKLYIK